MCQDKTARIIIKQGSGVPTIPVSADHRNGDWIATDIYEGEQYMDTDTGIVYTRSSTGIESVGGGSGDTTIKTKIVNIGDWNMDATGSVNIAHGIADYTKIRSVDVMIRPDSATYLIPLTYFDGSTTAGIIGLVDSTNIPLTRTAGANFDSTNFDSTSFNRGYITIQYID